jgi:hypothetical protein
MGFDFRAFWLFCLRYRFGGKKCGMNCGFIFFVISTTLPVCIFEIIFDEEDLLNMGDMGELGDGSANYNIWRTLFFDCVF